MTPVEQNGVVLYRIGDVELDSDARRLSGADGPRHVEPQVFDVLSYLVEHRDRAVAKTELLEEIWGDQFVSESALTSRIKSARAAIGDTGRDQRHIRTVHGFGYHLVSPVEVRTAPMQWRDVPAPGRSIPIPTYRNPFRGRDDECRDVSGLLDRHRLVTLLGPGGIGKTRLAVEVLAARGDRGQGESDEVPVFVDLAATRQQEAVPDTIARSLGIETGQRQDPMAALCEYLDAFPHVLLIDNCEHVLDAVSHAVGAIGVASSQSRVLATSREPLAVVGERLYRVGPLPLLTSDGGLTAEAVMRNPAAAVFLDRAQLADDRLLTDPENVRRIVELCHALDGLPLALELAAGRVAAFGLSDLLGLLDRPLDVLGDRSSARDHRHRTLRATVQWSYDLLSEPEQLLLRSLAVFPGGVTLDCISRLSGPLELGAGGLDAAARLVDASLVARADTGGTTRYRQLETLRSFGLDELERRSELRSARDLAAELVLEMLAEAEDGLHTGDERRWVARLRDEFPNIRSVRSHLLQTGRIDDVLAISKRLTVWARMRDATEVWAWSDDLVECTAERQDLRPTALAIRSQACWRRGDISGAIDDATEALSSSDDEWTILQALAELGTAQLFSGDVARAEATWTEQAERSNDVVAWTSAALAASYRRDIDTARALMTHGRACRGRFDLRAGVGRLHDRRDREHRRGGRRGPAGTCDPRCQRHRCNVHCRGVHGHARLGVGGAGRHPSCRFDLRGADPALAAIWELDTTVDDVASRGRARRGDAPGDRAHHHAGGRSRQPQPSRARRSVSEPVAGAVRTSRGGDGR